MATSSSVARLLDGEWTFWEEGRGFDERIPATAVAVETNPDGRSSLVCTWARSPTASSPHRGGPGLPAEDPKPWATMTARLVDGDDAPLAPGGLTEVGNIVLSATGTEEGDEEGSEEDSG